MAKCATKVRRYSLELRYYILKEWDFPEKNRYFAIEEG